METKRVQKTQNNHLKDIRWIKRLLSLMENMARYERDFGNIPYEMIRGVEKIVELVDLKAILAGMRGDKERG